jgi:exodeoxyribonuclease V alpha subunit
MQHRPTPPNANEGESITFEGTVDKVVFSNDATGFAVLRVDVRGDPFPRTVVGSLSSLKSGEQARFVGRWTADPRFGKQFNVESFTPALPADAQAIERYLGSGLVPGIGAEMARRMVERFGAQTLEIIEKDPERLALVGGIGPKRRAQIVKAWNDQKGIREVMIFLQGVGVSPAYAVRVFRQYGAAAPSVVKADPYRLARDIHGIGFKIADRIATELGFSPEDPRRLEAGATFTLWESQSDGHVYLPEGELTLRASELLGVDTKPIETAIDRLIEGGWLKAEALHTGTRAVYHPILRDHEITAARRLMTLLHGAKPFHTGSFPAQAVAAAQALSPGQQEAVKLALQSAVCVITGGPGTGKTTLVNALLGLLESKGAKVTLAAPTGRAAKRIEQSSGRPAQTIHRLLEFNPRESRFTRNVQNPLEAEFIVLDEASMIDLPLGRALLDAVKTGARLCLVGDVDQLPSVGPGLFLADIINSGVVPVARLTEVFRQAAQSHIVSAAHAILQGRMPESGPQGADFFVLPRQDPAQVLDTLRELVTRRIPRAFQLDPKNDIQILVPMHRGVIGVENLNLEMQNLLNPGGASLGPRSRGLRVGDKVMQVKNDYDKDVFNGDVGRIEGVNEEEGLVTIRFEDKTVLYPLTDIDELTLAYVISTHKSQGSEYPVVILPLVSQHYVMLQRNLLYTAVTRGRRLVIIVGDPKALRRAVQNDRPQDRYTRLAERLREEQAQRDGSFRR